MADAQASKGFRLPWVGRLRTRARWSEPPSAPDWRDVVKSRVIVIASLFALWTAGVEARLVYLQVFQYSEMVARADKQRMNTVDAPARRGDILDRNGRVLAYTVDADSIFADPSEIKDHEAVAVAVCRALDRCDAADRATISKNLKRSTQFVYLARKVSPEEEQRVRNLGLKGIGVMKESRRFYPKRELLAHVLGYVGTDNVGLAGLESSFDSLIRGQAGKILLQRDARRNALTSYVEREATTGATLELTIDQYLQNIAERELEAGVREFNAAGGAVVIMDPRTGEILAMANAPTFNPNVYKLSPEQNRRNRSIQDLYEPGSTFKIVTAAAALEEGLITPDDLIDVSAGRIIIGSRPPINDVHRYGVLTFSDVIVKSSNVGAIKVGFKLGAERLSRYVTRFGFGHPVVPDFRGENPGIVWDPTKLNDSAVASVSMGYQVGVTPVQMASAVSSVANGGTLYEPHIVRATIKDGQRVEASPKALRRTISERTAGQLTAIMEGVVEEGTAKKAQIAGYTIAGKTGTAHKAIPGGYSTTDYNASFVGFLPSRSPALAIVVVIDSPHGNGYMGGAVAAPIFKKIAEASLRHLGVAPTVNPMPPVLVARGVEEQQPILPRPVNYTPSAPEAVADGFMPDLRGLSAREALRTLTKAGVTARLNGNGFVIEQSPAAGTAFAPGDTCTLKLGRRPLAPPLPGAPQ